MICPQSVAGWKSAPEKLCCSKHIKEWFRFLVCMTHYSAPFLGDVFPKNMFDSMRDRAINGWGIGFYSHSSEDCVIHMYSGLCSMSTYFSYFVNMFLYFGKSECFCIFKSENVLVFWKWTCFRIFGSEHVFAFVEVNMFLYFWKWTCFRVIKSENVFGNNCLKKVTLLLYFCAERVDVLELIS